GALTLNADGSFDYQPDPHFGGTDAFTYQATDGTDDSNVATVTIDVTNAVPVASDDAFSVTHDQPLHVAAGGVLGNDTDANGDGLSAVPASNPAHGTLLFHADGAFDYVPDPHYVGNDTFTYLVSDDVANSDPATVTVSVTNTAPVAADDLFQVLHDQPLH